MSPSVVLLASVATAAGLGCSSARGAVPPGAHVEVLQTERIVLRGTAAANAASASCADPSGRAEPQYLELKEDAAANVILRPIAGVAVLHVRELASSRTWCAMSPGDGAGAAIPGEFPAGVYAISVQGSRSTGPLPYTVAFEKL
jgi:hypothetical protein